MEWETEEGEKRMCKNLGRQAAGGAVSFTICSAAPTALPSAGTHPKHPCGMPGGKAGTMDHGKVLEVRGQLVSDLGMKS